MQKLVVVDYGMGNLRSVAKAFEFVVREHALPFQVSISGSPQDVANADRVVFPGQGAMPDCMKYLRESGLEQAVRDAANSPTKSKPFFGVCVGMQMLFDTSEEANMQTHTDGLGIFSGTVKKFHPADASLKVPHMGWNEVYQCAGLSGTHPLWKNIPDAERFYFVHSYYCEPSEAEPAIGNANKIDRDAKINKASNVRAAMANYGIRFTAAIARDNIFATQFHPEKSHHAGLTLYKNFLQWNP